MFGHAASSVCAVAAPVLSAADVAVACAPSLTLVPERPVARPSASSARRTPCRARCSARASSSSISGGTGAGVQLGQQYFIRRAHAVRAAVRARQLQTIHTTGWLRIVAVNDTTAIAQIEHDLRRRARGRLPRAVRGAPSAAGGEIHATLATLDFSSLGRVLFGDEERRIAGPGDFMMLEYGDTAVAPGTRVAVYRDLRTPGVPLAAIGEGVIVSVTNGTPADAHHRLQGMRSRAATTWCRTSRAGLEAAGQHALPTAFCFSYPAFLSDRCSRATVMSAMRGLSTTLNRRK